MVDPARLRSILSRLREGRERLRGYAERELDQYLADPEAVAASKYVLLAAIEDALAAANQVIASEG